MHLRKLLIFASIATTLIWATACKESSDKTQKETDPANSGKVRISGVLNNTSSKKFAITFVANVMSRDDSVLVTDSIDENGKFSVEFDLSEPVRAKFRNNRQYTNMYLSPGDTLFVTMDAEQFSDVQYSGTGEKINNYLAEKEQNIPSPRAMMSNLFLLGEDAFLAAMDSMKEASLQFLYGYEIGDESFLASEEKQITYQISDLIITYPDYYPYAQKMAEVEMEEEYIPSDKFKKAIEAQYIADESSLNKPKYTEMLNDFVYFKWNELEDVDVWEDWSKKANDLEVILGNEKVLEYFLAKELYDNSTYSGVAKDNLEALEQFRSKYPSSKYLAEIDAVLTEWDHLLEGKKAPTFAYADREGNTIALEDLKGKVVYVDVWATWCGPCKKEAPYFQELAEQFEGKDIMFLGVSVDEDEEAWIKYLIKKKPTTTQVFADGAWDSELVKSYNIAAIPRFILIDKEGNIIEASATRPSNEKTKEKLEKLLGVEA